MTIKITGRRLQQLIDEELRALVNESIDHESASAVATSASKLLKAIAVFKEKATSAAINAVTPHVTELEKVLENMVNTPGAYVEPSKKEPQKVSLKRVKND